MALITCPHCGGMVSDQAQECPHCGSPVASTTNAAPVQHAQPVQPVQPLQPAYAAPYQQNSGGKNKIAIGVDIGVAVLLIALIVVIIITSSGSNNGNSTVNPTNASSGFVQNNNQNGVNAQVSTYNVTLQLECRKNDYMNQYDVDILVDDEAIATHAHGTTDEYELRYIEKNYKVSVFSAKSDLLYVTIII